MNNMLRKTFTVLCLSVLALAFSAGPVLLSGCRTPQLESGGAYAPTNSVGQASAAPDPEFYAVDATFSLDYGLVQAVFQFERDNRPYLWGLDPNIKRTLDGLRPQVVEAVQNYFVGRDAYKANPTPAGLSTLQTVAGRMKQVAASAQAVTQQLQNQKH